MIKIAVAELPETREFPYAILHESGDVLREAGEPLSREDVDAMHQASIADVFLVEQDDDVYMVRKMLRAHRVPVAALSPTDEPDDPLLAVRIGLPREMRPMRFTDTTKTLLVRCQVRDVLVRKTPEQLREWQVSIFHAALAAREEVRAAAAREMARELARRARPLLTPPEPPEIEPLP